MKYKAFVKETEEVLKVVLMDFVDNLIITADNKQHTLDEVELMEFACLAHNDNELTAGMASELYVGDMVISLYDDGIGVIKKGQYIDQNDERNADSLEALHDVGAYVLCYHQGYYVEDNKGRTFALLDDDGNAAWKTVGNIYQNFLK